MYKWRQQDKHTIAYTVHPEKAFTSCTSAKFVFVFLCLQITNSDIWPSIMGSQSGDCRLPLLIFLRGLYGYGPTYGLYDPGACGNQTPNPLSSIILATWPCSNIKLGALECANLCQGHIE